MCCCRCKICSDVNSCCWITSLGGESYAAELPSVLETFEGMLFESSLCFGAHALLPPLPPSLPTPLPKTTQWQFWTTGVCVRTRSWVCLILFHQRTKCHLNGSSAHLFCVTENCHSRYTFFQERVAQTFPSNQNKVWLAFAKCVLSVFVFLYSWIFHWLLSTGIKQVTKVIILD